MYRGLPEIKASKGEVVKGAEAQPQRKGTKTQKSTLTTSMISAAFLTRKSFWAYLSVD